MARRSRNRQRRDVPTIANPILSRLPLPQWYPRPISNLRVIEDRRTFHPDFVPRTFSRSPAKIQVRNAPRNQKIQTPPTPRPHYSFNAPDRVLVCVRRQRRKEVLFAKRHAGKSGQRKPRFNQFSNISCKG